MNNLHITLNELRNASRVIKETQSIENKTSINKVYVAALLGEKQKECEYTGGIVINRFDLVSRAWNKSFFFQIIKYFEYMFKIAQYYKCKDIKMINIHSLGLLPIGVLLKYLYRAKLVYDAHELETEMNGLTGIRKTLSKILEKLLINKTDLIIVVSDSIADWYENKYNIERPIVVLNSPRFSPYSKSSLLRDRLGIPRSKKIALYQGGLARGRGIELLLDTFSQAKHEDIVIVFMGYGPLEEEIKKNSNEFSNIYFHEAVDPSILLEYTSSADFGISFIENTCLSYYYCLPNKLFEYSMAGLPVIVSNMKEMRTVVNTFENGVVAFEPNVESLNLAIDELLSHDIDELRANARLFAEKNCWEVQEKVMISAYNELGFGN